IGYLSSLSPDADRWRIAALRQSLAEAGYSEGGNLAFEYRWAEGDYDRLAAYAAEFVRRDVAVIFAASLPSALAAKAATTTIPIVFVMGADPVKLGVVADRHSQQSEESEHRGPPRRHRDGGAGDGAAHPRRCGERRCRHRARICEDRARA